MLNVSQLESGIKLAFAAGEDGAESDEVAVELADAIVSYGSGAEILMLPGPILIPAAPSPLPSSGNGAKLTVKTAESGRSALETGIKGQFSAGDPTMNLLAMAIFAYANSSFTVFSSTIGHTATGATLMAVPPILAPVVAAGTAGQDRDACIALMANIIHTSFSTSIFNGAGVASDGGLGAVAGQKLM